LEGEAVIQTPKTNEATGKELYGTVDLGKKGKIGCYGENFLVFFGLRECRERNRNCGK